MSTPQDVGTLIGALRRELGISQQTLAERAGIDRTRIVHLESGRHRGSSHEMRLALARGLGLEIAHLDAYLAEEASLRTTLRRCAAVPATGTEG